MRKTVSDDPTRHFREGDVVTFTFGDGPALKALEYGDRGVVEEVFPNEGLRVKFAGHDAPHGVTVRSVDLQQALGRENVRRVSISTKDEGDYSDVCVLDKDAQDEWQQENQGAFGVPFGEPYPGTLLHLAASSARAGVNAARAWLAERYPAAEVERVESW